MKICRLDQLARQDNLFEGGEPDSRYEKRQRVMVEDSYDFSANPDTDLCDTDSNAIDNLGLYGEELVGSATNFKDWMCLRDQIKLHVTNIAGTDYSTWASLSTSQKKVALIYCPTKIINTQGIVFFGTECAIAGLDANQLIDDYLIKAPQAREARYNKLVRYAYNELSTGDGLKAEDDVRNNNLNSKFQERGVVHTSEDGVDGLDDWIQDLGSFTGSSLKSKLNASTYTLVDGGLTVNDFCDNCSAIINDGKYS